MGGDLVLRGGNPWGHDPGSAVLVRGGRIAKVGEVSAEDAADAEVVDVTGRVVLPGLVEAHAHLDKTLTGLPWEPHSAGDALAERITNDRNRRHELGVPRRDGIRDLLRTMADSGTAYVRTHTDVDPEVGLRGIEAVAEVAAEMADVVSVEQVAFPQHGILATPGTAELLDAALDAGATVVGGIDPAGMDGDPVRHLDTVFGLVERHAARLDLHLHDGGTLGLWELDLVCERTRALALHGRVAVSHAYALGEASPVVQARVAERLADSGVAIVTAAVYDFPVAPVKVLRAAGVSVACGHDGIRDLWGPYGSGDMLERAMHLAYRSTFRRDDDIELALHAATYGGAALLGLDSYGLVEGAPAHLVVVPVETAAEAVVTHPPRELVLTPR